MRLFETHPGEATGSDLSIWHLDLDHVVSMQAGRRTNGEEYWFVQMSNQNNFLITKNLFDRMIRAWESK